MFQNKISLYTMWIWRKMTSGWNDSIIKYLRYSRILVISPLDLELKSHHSCTMVFPKMHSECNLTTACLPGLDNVTTTPGSDVNGTEGVGVPHMATYAQAILILMYSTITVVAVGGNIIVCYIVLAYQRMRTVTNYFIVNLACSDIMMASLCIPFTFIANVLMHYWPFGGIMCPLVSYAQGVSVFLKILT